VLVRTVFALLSAMVLLVAGYGWVHYSDLQNGLSTNDLTSEAGADGSIDILLVGVDSRTDAQGYPLPEEVLSRLRAGQNEANMTDTLMLVHIPNDGSRAVAFSFPRDSFVNIPDGYGDHKINSAFGRAKTEAATAMAAQGVADQAEIERNSSAAGRKVMLRTVEQLSGVSIDHYAEVNLLGFYELTKAVGGVPVCLNEPTSDPYSGASFPAGRQTISGSDALAFVRQRHGLPGGDLDRVVRQQAFLAGLTQSVLSSDVLASPSRLNELIASVQRSLVLDQGWDVLAFGEKMRGLAAGAITFQTIPIEDPAYDTPDDGEAIKIDPAQVRRAIRGAAGPPPPAQPPRFAGPPLVTLDGARRADPPAPPGQDAISADDVPCVN
jgi:LCP family protein required for cell wall assembly